MRYASFQQDTRNEGLTLIEVMIVVAILAVVVALAAPNLYELVIRNRLDTANNEFLTALNLARSEAVRRGVPVTMRRVSAAADCTAPTRDWTCGWQIFVDLNEDGICNNCDSSPESEITIGVAQPFSRTTPASARTLSLYSSPAIMRTFSDGRPNIPGALAEFIPFTPDGRIPLLIRDGLFSGEGAIGPHSVATFVLCHYVNGQPVLYANGSPPVVNKRRSRSRAVLLNMGGRPRQAVDANNDRRPENVWGVDIPSCTAP